MAVLLLWIVFVCYASRWCVVLSCLFHVALSQNSGRGWRRETGLSPPVKNIFTDSSKAVPLLWIIYVFVMLLSASVY